MSTAQWIKEAEEQAKKYSDSIKQSNQYLIDQLMASKDNTLAQLQKQQDNALYNLNTNQSTINKTAEDNAQQAYIQKVLALRSNEQAMNRAGLGTQGIVGSQVNAINSSYGDNLTSILNQKSSSLRDLEKEKTNANLTYDTNRLNLENEYGTNIANTKKSIEDSALNQYNNVYQNYLALKQQEYENEQSRLQAEEDKRRWEAEMALARYSSRKSGSSGGSGGIDWTNKGQQKNETSINGTQAANGRTITTNPYTKSIHPDCVHGVFDYGNNSGYQPNNIGKTKLTDTGLKVGYFGNYTNSGGKSINSQKVFKIGSGSNARYYVWDKYANEYKDFTNQMH